MTIDVNPAAPEQNREVLVVAVDSLKCDVEDDTLYSGFVIIVPGDPRWREESAEFYRAELLSKSVVKLTVPALPYTFALDPESLAASNIPTDLRNSLVQYSSTESNGGQNARFYKNIILNFPKDLWLEVSFVNKGKGRHRDETLGEWVLTPPKKYNDLLEGLGSEYWVMFSVACVNYAPRRIQPPFEPYNAEE